MRKIGLKVGGLRDRRLIATVGKRYRILFVRASDIPEFVQNGTVDVGITGLDLVREKGKDIEILLNLEFGKCRLVVATKENSDIETSNDIEDHTTVATAFPNLTDRYFKGLGKKIKIVPISGAAEVTPHIGVADLITDLTETGSTLVMNHLKIVDVILESMAVLVANREALETKGMIIKELRSALESVLQATMKRYLMANVSREKLDDVKALVPGVEGPTVLNIIGSEDMVAIHAVVDLEDVNGIIIMLKSLGGTGILVLPIERMVIR